MYVYIYTVFPRKIKFTMSAQIFLGFEKKKKEKFHHRPTATLADCALILQLTK